MIIDYQEMLDDAMLEMVKKILTKIQREGLQDGQCFYVSFRTDIPKVVLSGTVKKRYPQEITIVLQYQFRSLNVKQDSFSVNVSFGGVGETIEVPFHALTSFVDPASKFSLQFNQYKKFCTTPRYFDTKLSENFSSNDEPNSGDSAAKADEADVVYIDKFRKR
jgi:hypothetical protein